MKIIIAFSLILFFNHALFCQKTKLITIHVIDSIEAKKYSFLTRKNNEPTILPFNFKGNNIELKFEYLTIYPYLNIIYNAVDGNNYSVQLILNTKKHSHFTVLNNFSSDSSFNSYPFKNALNIQNDSIMRGMFNLFKIEMTEVMSFMGKHGDAIFKSDSLRHDFKTLVLAVHEKQLGYILNHTNNYILFWYFKNYVLSNLVLCRSNEVNDYIHLLNYFIKNFPSKFRNSTEGKFFENQIKTKIDGLNGVNKFKFSLQY